MSHAGLEKNGAQVYNIVHVPKQDEVTAVPSAWVVGDQVLWPPYQSTAQEKTEVEDQEEPSERWTSQNCRVLFTCAGYDIAKQKEQQAALTSGPARAPLNSVSQPPTPKFRKTAHSKGTTVALQPIAPSPKPVAATLQALPTASVQPILKMQEETFKLLKEMKAQLDTLQNAMQGLENSVGPRQTSRNPADSGMLDLLPLASHQDLEELEECLRTPKNRTALVAHFSRLEGSCLMDTLRYLMRKCMKDGLAQDFSLMGRKGKMAFNALRLLQVVTETLQKAYTTATEADVHCGIATWLRHAPSRLKNREAALASEHQRSALP